MNRPGVLQVLFFGLILVVFGCSAELAFAGVHGGGGGWHGGGGGGWHGGGGGFHGGGGGWHGGGYGGWHGGGYGGWHGGGYGGWHGGYGGWYGGWRSGYGGWGWGWPWGFGLSFNFGWPYYGYYGYPYAYSYPYPYYYPYYPYSNYAPGYYAPSGDPSGYSDPAPPTQTSGTFQNSGPRRPPAAPANTVTLQEAVHRPPADNYGTASAVRGASYRPASAESQLPPMRPEVQNVIRALRAMPPEARQEQIDSGRYGNLSPEEMKLVRDAADVPSGNF